MAIDSRDKRDSAINLGLPWRMRFPVPDGSLALLADRLHLTYLYRMVVIPGDHICGRISVQAAVLGMIRIRPSVRGRINVEPGTAAEIALNQC